MSNQSEKGLMSKTKKELVEIILRKDDVERQLKSDKDGYERKCKHLEEINVDLSNKIEKYEKSIAEKETEIDLHMSTEKALNSQNEMIANDFYKARRQRNIFIISSIVLAFTTIILAIC